MGTVQGSNHVNMMLTEIERHDGLCILATNRPCAPPAPPLPWHASRKTPEAAEELYRRSRWRRQVRFR
jgi:hypothetical protein